jgi:L-2,4-diaminobutyrate decarboxylase
MDALKDAFDAEVFRRQGHQVVDQLADYLAQAFRGGALPVLPWTEPQDLLPQWPADFPARRPRDTLKELLARTLAQSNHLHHPRYMGHQVTAPLPLAAVCELAMTLLNDAMAVYEMGPVGTAMERNLVGWLAKKLALGPRADGIFTSGGSAGNLTALLAARQAQAGFDVWNDGLYAGPPLAFLVSEQAHYSVLRAVQILGLGRAGAVPVPVDEHYRLRVDALPEALAGAHTAGRKVLGLCASSCSTATGAFDPLEPLADFCAAHGLWLHVDGAHGASASLSAKYGFLLNGIGRASSVVWDAHKMLLMPALCTAVLFREGRNSYHAFAQHASYLFAGQRPEEEWYNSAVRTLECTKRMMSFPLYACLAVWGTQLFDDYVTRTFDLGRRLGERLAAEADFGLPVPPECNIVCFRYTPPGVTGAALDDLQAKIRMRLIAEGSFYIVQTRLPSGLHLRVTLINPLTGDGDLAALIEAVRAAGKSILHPPVRA